MLHRLQSTLTPLRFFLVLLAGFACTRPQAPSAAELALGTAAPNFQLRGVDGKQHALPTSEEAKVVVVVFTSLTCPVARAYEDRIIALARDYAERQVQVVAIVANDPKVSRDDGFDNMKARSAEKKYPFIFLNDDTQKVAKAYGASVTPHVFAFGPDRKLAYRGRVDDSTDPAKVEQTDLRNALDDLLAGKEVKVASTKAFGCTIKWKKETS